MTLSRELIRTVFMAVALLGIAAMLYAGYQYLDARAVLASAPQLDQRLDGLEQAQLEAVLAAIPREAVALQQKARSQQSDSLVIGGAGLIALGIGWLGYDLTKRRTASNGGDSVSPT